MDIEYTSAGQLIAIEVKASGGPAFPSFELTANEWNAATRLGAAYRLVLIAQVKTTSPQVQIIDDLAALAHQGRIDIEPALWRVVMNEKPSKSFLDSTRPDPARRSTRSIPPTPDGQEGW